MPRGPREGCYARGCRQYHASAYGKRRSRELSAAATVGRRVGSTAVLSPNADSRGDGDRTPRGVGRRCDALGRCFGARLGTPTWRRMPLSNSPAPPARSRRCGRSGGYRIITQNLTTNPQNPAPVTGPLGGRVGDGNPAVISTGPHEHSTSFVSLPAVAGRFPCPGTAAAPLRHAVGHLGGRACPRLPRRASNGRRSRRP